MRQPVDFRLKGTAAMAAKVALAESPESNAITAFLNDPACVLNEDGLIDQILEELTRRHGSLPTDMSTKKARDARRSAAAEIARMKAPVDTAAKKLTEEFRKKTADVNGRRRIALEKLEDFQHDLRKPLTDWEEAAKARQDKITCVFEQLNAAAHVGFDDTPESVAARIEQVQAIEIAPDVFQDDAEAAEAKRTGAIETLTAAHARLVQAAKEREELEQRRREDEERQAKERERAEAEQREAEARTRAEEAAERAREDERRRIDQEAEERVQAAEREAQRLRDEQAAREAEDQRKQEAEKKRAADAAHRRAIILQVAEDIAMASGIDQQGAEDIATAIADGQVRHTAIKF
jgi:septal ring factor EnvC (AmiA/AmiB activator)